MTLVNITLTEDEQEILLEMSDWTPGDYAPEGSAWSSIAEKIRRARDTGLFEIYPPDENDGHQRLEAERIARAGNHS